MNDYRRPGQAADRRPGDERGNQLALCQGSGRPRVNLPFATRLPVLLANEVTNLSRTSPGHIDVVARRYATGHRFEEAAPDDVRPDGARSGQRPPSGL